MLAWWSPRAYFMNRKQPVGLIMMLKWMPEIDDLTDICRTKRYVRLDVLPMPSDPTTVAGLVSMDDNREHLPGFHRSDLPMQIEVARSLAQKIARERAADVIWISDPKGLYPQHDRMVGRMRTCFRFTSCLVVS